MPFRPLLLQRKALPAAAALLTAAAIITPRNAYAESPETTHQIPTSKKPIYDDPEPVAGHPAPSAEAPSFPKASIDYPPASSADIIPTSSTTPTDRLTAQVRTARLQLYNLSTRAENSLNDFMTGALRMEHSVANTVASLAPSPTANEALMPGLIYVLVSAMAGSILTRNRNILLRATVPVLFGITAGYVAIPVTMRNVGNLVWTYEERFPVVRDTHLRIKDQTQHIWETGKAHTGMTVARTEGLLDEAREKMEDWMKKGK